MVALFATDDEHHARFDNLLRKLSREGLRLLTTWPCVVEAAYLLDVPQRFELLHWIELGAAQVVPFGPHHLAEMLPWMRRYTGRKRDMDLADASLYWLATTSGVCAVLTVDETDFTRYRLPDGKRFEIL
jgi:uncharacterized protein